MKPLIVLVSVSFTMIATIACGQKPGPIPNSPAGPCWNGATIDKLKYQVGTCGVGACTAKESCSSIKTTITLKCDKLNGLNRCNYCFQYQYQKWDGTQYIDDPAVPTIIGDNHLDCTLTQTYADIDNTKCDTKGLKRQVWTNVYNGNCDDAGKILVVSKSIEYAP